jgi:hypothetical protein
MRIVGDIVNYDVLQVEKTPDPKDASPFNGRFGIPVPGGASVHVDSDSYILPQDGGDLASQCAQALLAQFPMYSHIVYNFLLEGPDIADLDLAATGPGGEQTRVQTGRGIGPDPIGQVPNTTLIHPQHIVLGVPRPGCLVTDVVDIGPMTGGAGADEFLLWWYIWEFDTTEDVASDYGATAGANTPAYRNVFEVDQEPLGWEVWITHSNGASWTGPVGRIEPTDLIVFNTQVRLAFLNRTATKRYLAAYAFMF